MRWLTLGDFLRCEEGGGKIWWAIKAVVCRLDREEVLECGRAGRTGMRMRMRILEELLPIYNEMVKVSFGSDITTE